EAHHLDNALAICAEFARVAGFVWQGGLALGGGEMVHGEPLATMDGRVMAIRQALTMAAEALAQGQPIPLSAQRRMRQRAIPAWLYRLMGSIGWRTQARRWGMQRQLNRRPYRTK
ncbi:MAG: NAD(P)H dehydrogenase, partial [Chloroflexus sp.]